MERLGPAEFSARSGLSAKALRLYEERGILRPLHADPTTGYRSYSADQLQVAGYIALMRRAGIGLTEIHRFIQAPSLATIHRWASESAAEHTERLRSFDALSRAFGDPHERSPNVSITTIRPVSSTAELADAFDLAGRQFEPPITRDDATRWGAVEDAFPEDHALQLRAELDGQLVGAALGFMDPRGESATLRILGVDSAHRGAGLGVALLRAFEAGVRLRGGRAVWLGADHNAGFYVRHGYRTMVLIQWAYDPDIHRAEADALLTGLLKDTQHWDATFEGIPQLFVVLDEPNPALLAAVSDRTHGAHVGYCMSRAILPDTAMAV